MREKVKKEYFRQLKKICRTELTGKNKITAINQLEIPVGTYGFGVIDWPNMNWRHLILRPENLLSYTK